MQEHCAGPHSLHLHNSPPGIKNNVRAKHNICCVPADPSGSKVVPGFGIHPWWSHLHASSQGDSWQQLLEAPSQQQLQAALDILSTTDPVTNSGAYATNRPHAPGHTSNTATAPSRSSGSSDGSFTGIHANISQGLSEQQRCCLGEGLRVVPQEEWQGRLRQLLTDLPGAIVGGECASLVLASALLHCCCALLLASCAVS